MKAISIFILFILFIAFYSFITLRIKMKAISIFILFIAMFLFIQGYYTPITHRSLPEKIIQYIQEFY